MFQFVHTVASGIKVLYLYNSGLLHHFTLCIFKYTTAGMFIFIVFFYDCYYSHELPSYHYEVELYSVVFKSLSSCIRALFRQAAWHHWLHSFHITGTLLGIGNNRSIVLILFSIEAELVR